MATPDSEPSSSSITTTSCSIRMTNVSSGAGYAVGTTERLSPLRTVRGHDRGGSYLHPTVHASQSMAPLLGDRESGDLRHLSQLPGWPLAIRGRGGANRALPHGSVEQRPVPKTQGVYHRLEVGSPTEEEDGVDHGSDAGSMPMVWEQARMGASSPGTHAVRVVI